ncbi:class I SAM-dependent methyltransferase [Nocardioides sp. cx-169]|uniref:class I SAM-dependent methyltransferase n=1 Tax=Nocardioides sp. cx-169 TaxID=2899080 RepID=UPI001E5346FB|nr:class I SAM-dependent methyltransferase [Nocardioides sp. cx-169]MCD4532878.1 class I SAM-dependent methyltransferase [Nocardioides sp. cx-169]
MIEAEPMIDEFDTVASWTASAVRELGEDHALPAACRGSGSPAALDWLGSAMGLGEGARLLDSGAGVGGPSEYAARSWQVRPLLAEPMEGACRASRSLFGRPVVVADGAALPFRDGSVEAAWSLGVLCTLADKPPYLAELRRVVVAGGAVGLLVYERAVDSLPDQPEGNHFPSHQELLDELGASGLEVVGQTLLTDLPGTPDDWQEAADRVEDLIRERHGDDERWQRAQEQQDTIVRLIGEGLVVGRLVSCVAAPA